MIFKIITKLNKNGRKFHALVLDNGYSQRYISFDTKLIMECLDISPSSLDRREVGEETIIAKGGAES